MRVPFQFFWLILGGYLGESWYQNSLNPSHWTVAGWLGFVLGLIVGSAILAWGRE